MDMRDLKKGATLDDIDNRLESLVIVMEDIRDILKAKYGDALKKEAEKTKVSAPRTKK